LGWETGNEYGNGKWAIREINLGGNELLCTYSVGSHDETIRKKGKKGGREGYKV
jgi:hypothetical protein